MYLWAKCGVFHSVKRFPFPWARQAAEPPLCRFIPDSTPTPCALLLPLSSVSTPFSLPPSCHHGPSLFCFLEESTHRDKGEEEDWQTQTDDKDLRWNEAKWWRKIHVFYQFSPQWIWQMKYSCQRMTEAWRILQPNSCWLYVVIVITSSSSLITPQCKRWVKLVGGWYDESSEMMYHSCHSYSDEAPPLFLLEAVKESVNKLIIRNIVLFRWRVFWGINRPETGGIV